MKFAVKFVLPAVLFASAVFIAEGVSGFTSAQLSLFYSVFTLHASAFATSLIMAIGSMVLIVNNAIQKRKRKKI